MSFSPTVSGEELKRGSEDPSPGDTHGEEKENKCEDPTTGNTKGEPLLKEELEGKNFLFFNRLDNILCRQIDLLHNILLLLSSNLVQQNFRSRPRYQRDHAPSRLSNDRSNRKSNTSKINHSQKPDIDSNITADHISANTKNSEVKKFDVNFHSFILDETEIKSMTTDPKYKQPEELSEISHDNKIIPKIECFMLSLNEESNDINNSDISYNTKTKVLKSNIDSLLYIKKNSEQIIEALKLQNSSENSEIIKEANAQLNALDKHIKENNEKLEKIYQLKEKFQEKLQLPNFGSNDTYDPEEAVLSCQYFTGIKDTITLQQWWNKIACFTETKELSETAVKKLLGCLLNGPAHETFIDNRQKDLSIILQCLLDRHGSVETMSDKINCLDNIKRAKNEKLSSLMARISSLVDATNLLVKEDQRDPRKEIIMTEKLINLCSERAKQAILRERAKAARSGYILSYKNLYSIAADIENSENKNFDSNSFTIK